MRLLATLLTALIALPASAFSLYCEPLNVSLISNNKNFRGSCNEYKKEDSYFCFPFRFHYESPDKYGRKEYGAKSDFELLSASPYEYKFREVGVDLVDITSDLTIDRRTLEFTYIHGHRYNAEIYFLFLESGECALIEEEYEKPKI